MNMKKFKKGDLVLVTSGRDKGKQGEIIKLFPREDKVLVKGVSLYKRHVKPQGNREGGIVSRERPLPTAKIMIMVDGKPVRASKRVRK